LADSNFSVFDLDERYLRILQAQKPKLISDQLATTPVEILKSPDWIKQNEQYKNIVLHKLPALRGLLENQSIDNWVNAVIEDENLIVYAPDEYPNYRNELLNYLINTNNPSLLLKVRKKYRRDFEFLSELLSERWSMLGAIPTNTPRYRDLAIIAIKTDPEALDIVPEELRDREMCLTAVNQNGEALVSVPEKLKDYEMCLTAVNKNVTALKSVPENLPQYRDIVLAALQKNGHTLAYVPEELRDYDLCFTAVTQPDIPEPGMKSLRNKLGPVLKHVPENFRNYKMCIESVKREPYSIRHVPIDLPEYTKICLAAVTQDGEALEFIHYGLRDREICLAAVTQNGRSLRYVPDHFRDREMYLATVKQDSRALGLVPYHLRPEIEKALANEKNKTDESINRLKQMAGIN
jgi:hypothetical protein